MILNSMRVNVLLCLIVISSAAKAGPVWEKQITKWGLNRDKQSYCYMNDKGEVKGTNINIPIKLASVAKLYTTYYALSKLGPDKEFITKAYVHGDQLHISGSLDPLFGYRKIFHLLDKLHSQGFDHFSKVTFDANLVVVPDLLEYNEWKEYPSKEKITKYLNLLFNKSKWGIKTKRMYRKLQDSTIYPGMETNISKDINVSSDVVAFAEEPPFALEEASAVLKITSAPLKTYMKYYNITSNNGLAEFTFRAAGDLDDFHEFIRTEFPFSGEAIKFYTGSGLPRYVNKKRKDNLSTCSYTVQLLEKLELLAEEKGIDIQDIMAVAGVDKGTLKSKYGAKKYRRVVVAKTGTLNSASALAGYINSEDQSIPFGLFESTVHVWKAKELEKKMVEAFLGVFAPLHPVHYPESLEFFSLGKEAEWE